MSDCALDVLLLYRVSLDQFYFSGWGHFYYDLKVEPLWSSTAVPMEESSVSAVAHYFALSSHSLMSTLFTLFTQSHVQLSTVLQLLAGSRQSANFVGISLPGVIEV